MAEIPSGRLLCVGIRGTTPGDAALEHDLDKCARAGVGGVILFDVHMPTFRLLECEGVSTEQAVARSPRNITGPDQLKELIAHIRARLGRHVLISIDQEGGRVARLSPRRGFAPDPSAAQFASADKTEQEATAARRASMLRALDIDLNFAPCVDLAIDPQNDIIAGNERSFGSDPELVIDVARTVLDAHARAGVATCLKHFPGHGSSCGDTHLGVVDITHTWQRETELAPYRALANRPGVAVMVAHISHRLLDPDQPASLSPIIVGELLRGEIEFDGVVVTDSIDMRAITDRWTPGEAVVAAVNAGADLVLDGFNQERREEHPAVDLASELNTAIEEGRIIGGRERIEDSVRRVDSLRAQIGRSAGEASA